MESTCLESIAMYYVRYTLTTGTTYLRLVGDLLQEDVGTFRKLVLNVQNNSYILIDRMINVQFYNCLSRRMFTVKHETYQNRVLKHQCRYRCDR